jgi:hypothetical protein
MREYYKRSAKHRMGVRSRSKRWRADNREFANFQNQLARYGLTLDQYHAKLEAQDFCCAICGAADPTDIDHCHKTDRVRNILCRGCNTAIGLLKESPVLFQRALEYTQRWI